MVNGSPMQIFVFEPKGDGPHPAIIVRQHLPVALLGIGENPFTLDIEAIWAFSSSRSEIFSDRIGIMGHCWGRRVKQRADCKNPEYPAAALF